MEVVDLSIEDMDSRSIEKDNTPAEFKRGDKRELLREIHSVPDLYPEKLDEIVDNHNVRIKSYNVVQSGLIAMQIEAPDIDREIEEMEIKDAKIIEENQARLWLRS